MEQVDFDLEHWVQALPSPGRDRWFSNTDRPIWRYPSVQSGTTEHDAGTIEWAWDCMDIAMADAECALINLWDRSGLDDYLVRLETALGQFMVAATEFQQLCRTFEGDDKKRRYLQAENSLLPDYLVSIPALRAPVTELLNSRKVQR